MKSGPYYNAKQEQLVGLQCVWLAECLIFIAAMGTYSVTMSALAFFMAMFKGSYKENSIQFNVNFVHHIR